MASVKTEFGKVIRNLIPYFPHKIAHSFLFYRNHKYFLNWKNPKTYDEKMTWALANLVGKEEALYADKYAVRSYVEEMGYSQYLPKVYGVWKNADDIDFDILPNQFVLKTNHAAGDKFYYICKDKNQLDKNEVCKKFQIALKSSIWKNQCEYHYKYIEPIVFAEEFLNDGRESRMTDYKIHCFDGKPECVLVCTNRANDLKLDYYDLNWNYLDVVPEKFRSGHSIQKPKGLNTMIEIAAKLSSRFPTARIDFYDIDGKVYFGEITLTPAGGNLRYINQKWQKIFGDKINFDGYTNSMVKRS